MQTSPLYAYNASAVVVVDYNGAVGIEHDVYLRVAITVYVVTIIMRFMEGAWTWSSERLEDRPNSDLQMVKSEHGVCFSLLVR